MVLEEVFRAFTAYEPSMESHFHKWVQQSPSSYSALLARSSYFVSRARAGRDTCWAKDTSVTQFAHMQRNLGKATEDVASALKLKGKRVVCFELILSIEMLAPIQ